MRRNRTEKNALLFQLTLGDVEVEQRELKVEFLKERCREVRVVFSSLQAKKACYGE
jgi:hypothetical protein